MDKTIRFFRRHWPLLLLMAGLAVFGWRTLGGFLISDDLTWVERTAADAAKPWNAFVEPLFGAYYRPMAHLFWLACYYLFGLNFAGYNVLFLLLWLGCVLLIYALGCRLGGRAAGLIAAALLGLNDTWLLLVSWKSWTTTLVEFAAVLAWAIAWTRWLETRARGPLIASIVLGIVAVLARELAPLVISAVVLVTFVLPTFRVERRRGWISLPLWAVVTATVILAVPSYRASVASLLHQNTQPATDGAQPAFTLPQLVYNRYYSHTESILYFGLSRFALLAAMLWGLRRRLGPDRFTRIRLLGVGVIAALLLGLERWITEGLFVLLKTVIPALTPGWLGDIVQIVLTSILLAGFLAVSLTGDRWSRMLGIWFLVSFLPILPLEHSSNAYHMLAFAALALYVGRETASFLAAEAMPAWRRLRGLAGETREDDARLALIIVAAIVAGLQIWMLGTNPKRTLPTVKERVAFGQQMQGVVDDAVRNCASSESRKVWVDGADRYAALAGLILAQREGFARNYLDPLQVGLRRFNSPLRIYTGAVEYNAPLFKELSIFPNGGFEEPTQLTRATEAHSGEFALASDTAGDEPRNISLTSPPFDLSGGAYVFGGFLKQQAESANTTRMVMLKEERGLFTTPSIHGPDWQLVWACMAVKQRERFQFAAIESSQLRNGRILCDDIFLIPVERLEEAANRP